VFAVVQRGVNRASRSRGGRDPFKDRPSAVDALKVRARPIDVGRLIAAARNVLPKGRPLPDAAWARRHRTILALLWIHAVGLAVFGIARGSGVWHSTFEGSIVAAFAVAASIGLSQRVRAVMASFGILSSSAILVHLSGGTIEAHFHFFVMVGVISLYQDWTPFLVAVGYVVVHHGTLGVLEPQSVYNHAAALANPWLWAGINGLFILGACAVSLVAWRLNEDARARAEEYYRRLYEGERGVVKELREAQTMKDELIAMVSHELRTPLTSIIGFGRTLQSHWDRLADAERIESVDASVRQAERLRRHVENLLEAARVSERDPLASADLGEIVGTVLAELGDIPDSERVAIEAQVPSVAVGVSPDALHLIVVNVVGNALKYAILGSVVGVVGGVTGAGRGFLTVANQAPPIAAEDLERIFEPFVQLDSSATREAQGMGLGLHIVRRMVDLHEGSVDVAYREGYIHFRIELPMAHVDSALVPPEPDAASIPSHS
jgi:signal transduction histidine kinase